jgi:hypothetical protein
MIRRGALVAALLSGLLASGCLRSERVDVGTTPGTFRADEYARVLRRWTRAKLVVHSFDTLLHGEVTYLSPEFMAAYTALYAEQYQLSRKEAAAFRTLRLADVTTRHEFFLAAATSDPTWNDLERDTTMWRITLVDDRGVRARPISVERLRPTEVHRAYFPYLNAFHRVYHLIFPRTASGQPFVTPATRFFKLVLTCPLGAAEFTWFVKAPGRR